MSYTKYLNIQVQAGALSNLQDIEIPAEYDFKAVLIYYSSKSSVNFLFGADYIRLSSFNTDSLDVEDVVELRNYNIYYLTLGASHRYSLWGKKMFSMLSLSLSVMSSDDKFDSSPKAEKLEFQTKMKLFDRYFAHFYYVHHRILNKTLLEINKIGAGVGATF
jgi:hypothetical protein